MGFRFRPAAQNPIRHSGESLLAGVRRDPGLSMEGTIEAYDRSLTSVVRIGEAAGVAVNEDQRRFLGALAQAAALFDSEGLARREWMVIAGGGVYLHQLEQASKGRGLGADRIPTDLDIVVNNKPWHRRHILEVMQDALKPIPSRITTGPLQHFGHTLRGPSLTFTASNKLPIDIITELSHTYSGEHWITPFANFEFPPAYKLLPFAKPIQAPGVEDPILVAHPGFIAFYKAMLSRNTDGKQDHTDLRRLREMGLLDRSAEMSTMLNTMVPNEPKLVDALFQRFAGV